MNIRLASFALLLAGLSSQALAQNNTLLFENFESGVPANWSAGAPWHLAQNGECGAVTRMMACNSGAPGCNYGGIPGFDGLLLSPEFGSGAGQYPWQISFDYILDIDPTGDQVGIAVTNTSGQLIFDAQTSRFVNDGVLHTLLLSFNGPSTPFAAAIGIFMAPDGIGDLGRGLLIDNVRISNSLPGQLYCDTLAAGSCPCSGGGIWRGCGTSLGAGASLRGNGNPSVSADSFELGVVDAPSGSPTLYFEGSAVAGMTFGDGRLCAGGSLVRLGVQITPSRNSAFPQPNNPPLSVLSPVTAGATRYYQAIFRDVGGPCGTGFNLTNGWRVTWGP
jgi:hypothetical protein